MEIYGNKDYIEVHCQKTITMMCKMALWHSGKFFAIFSSVFTGDRQGYYSILNTQSYMVLYFLYGIALLHKSTHHKNLK